MTQHSRDTPQFYLTAPSPCPYLAGQEERKVFTHLVGERAAELNDLLTWLMNSSLETFFRSASAISSAADT